MSKPWNTAADHLGADLRIPFTIILPLGVVGAQLECSQHPSGMIILPAIKRLLAFSNWGQVTSHFLLGWA
jgi:hypothetical protein